MRMVIVVSANAEWRAVRDLFPQAALEKTPYGEWFEAQPGPGLPPAVFLHGG